MRIWTTGLAKRKKTVLPCWSRKNTDGNFRDKFQRCSGQITVKLEVNWYQPSWFHSKQIGTEVSCSAILILDARMAASDFTSEKRKIKAEQREHIAHLFWKWNGQIYRGTTSWTWDAETFNDFERGISNNACSWWYGIILNHCLWHDKHGRCPDEDNRTKDHLHDQHETRMSCSTGCASEFFARKKTLSSRKIQSYFYVRPNMDDAPSSIFRPVYSPQQKRNILCGICSHGVSSHSQHFSSQKNKKKTAGPCINHAEKKWNLSVSISAS